MSKPCYLHNAVVARGMDGEKGHALTVDEVGPRWKWVARDLHSHKAIVKVPNFWQNYPCPDLMYVFATQYTIWREFWREDNYLWDWKQSLTWISHSKLARICDCGNPANSPRHTYMSWGSVHYEQPNNIIIRFLDLLQLMLRIISE